ncbi:MAG: RNA degradosome polyphosphate kinase [Sphaerospermopsis sp. SIO1G2]|nr:RNA degradosome polyphosphate kinase [Sphaerospermopsis sp. SIO1G2]
MTDTTELTHQQRQARYINRELSAIAFNHRVLEEAFHDENPLLERLRYLSISSSNLDEFTMVRVAGLKEQVRHHIANMSVDGLTPSEQLAQLSDVIQSLLHAQQSCWLALRDALADEHIHVISPKTLDEDRLAALEMQFLSDIFPALSPIAIDPAHPFPFLANLSLTQAFELRNDATGEMLNAVLPLPHTLPRFCEVKGHDGQHFILLEDITRCFAHLLFPGFSVIESAIFRIIRDSDLEVEEDAEDLLRHYEHAVKQRRRGQVIRVKTMKGAPLHLVHFFTSHLETDIRRVHEMDGMLGLVDVSELCQLDRPDLLYPPYEVRFPERIHEYNGDCFAAIASKDIIIHHPYESFDVVVQFLNQAARDPDVVSIKQTLYRTSENSPIVKALIRAAEHGKSVTALVELRARFDEVANIRWARDLERAGVQVVYGFVHLKTHAKISIVVRRQEETLVSYAHFGTGNYHPITAKIYTDLSYFTCNAELTHEAHCLFNHITGYGALDSYQTLIPAPEHLRDRLISLIEAEAAYAAKGKPAAIWAKMNALVDPALIEALYAASCAGVKIELVVRGICGLRPGVSGLSENITVKSIVGRFLEHSRIYCFGNGHGLPSDEARVFIGSADWMQRNMDWRIEVMVPMTNPTVHAQVLDQIMVANLKDDTHSWLLQSDGSYKRCEVEEHFSAHRYFIENPSLSGRGKALGQEKRARRTKRTKRS